MLCPNYAVCVIICVLNILRWRDAKFPIKIWWIFFKIKTILYTIFYTFNTKQSGWCKVSMWPMLVSESPQIDTSIYSMQNVSYFCGTKYFRSHIQGTLLILWSDDYYMLESIYIAMYIPEWNALATKTPKNTLCPNTHLLLSNVRCREEESGCSFDAWLVIAIS